MFKVLKYKKLVILFSVFIISTLLITCFTVFIIHKNSIITLKENLYHISVSQNQLIDILAKQGLSENDIISIYKKSVQSNLYLGETGEFVIGKFKDDSLIFIYTSNALTNVKSFHFEKKMAFATPMQNALLGKNGIINGIDYNNKKVYAAYIYNKTFKWGIVTKIQQSEVNKPFINAFIFSLLVAVFLIGLVSIIYILSTYPFLEKLMDSEKKFRLFFENSAEIIFIYDTNGQILDANESFCLDLGINKNILNKIFVHDIEFIDKKTNIEENIKYIQYHGFNKYESTLKKIDGTYIHIEVHAKSILQNDKNIIIAVAHDITERKQFIQKLLNSERLYRILTENNKDVISSFDTSTFQYIYLSPSIEGLRGYTVDEVMALPIDASIKPELRSTIRQMVNERVNIVRETGLEHSYVDQVEQLHKNGSIVWTELVSTFYLNQETGRVEVQGITRDISERIKDKENLEINEARYLKAQRIGKIGNWEFNIKNKLFWASDEAKRLCNLPIEQSVFTIGEIKKYIPDWDTIYNDLLNLISSNNNCILGLIIQNKTTDSKVITELIAELVCDSNSKPILVSGVIQDITEKKKVEKELIEYQQSLKQQNEEYLSLNEELNESNRKIQTINLDLSKAKIKAEESDRLKSAFLANMSHEIRTPMNAIVGFSEMLIKPQLSEIKKERYALIIKERTYDLLRIVEDLLDVSKIEVGQLKIFESNVDVSDIFIDLYEYYHQKLIKSDKKDDLSLKLNLGRTLKNKIIYIDGQRFKQIFTNLLDNAFKFTQKGVIEFGCRLNGDGKILFFVHDTGIGIPIDKQNLVFDRFRQADESLAGRQFGGTGLGLSIVKGIIKLMNGSIWLESTPNIGTSFFFTLPFSISLQDEDTDEEQLISPDNKWENKLVLIVEDDVANSEYLKEALTETGLNLLFAENGEEALVLFHNNPNINLILMDIRLPDTNGLQLTKIIKNENNYIPVIAQTAYASPVDIKNCLDAGCSDYISKPINYTKLIELIDKHLSKNIIG